MSDYGRRINWDSYYDPPEYPDPLEICQIVGCSEPLYNDWGDPLEGIDADHALCAPHNHALQRFHWITLCPECGKLHSHPTRLGNGRRVMIPHSNCFLCDLVWSDMEAW